MSRTNSHNKYIEKELPRWERKKKSIKILRGEVKNKFVKNTMEYYERLEREQ